MTVFGDGPFLPPSQPEPDKGNFFSEGSGKGNFFPVIRVTPNVLRMIDALAAAGAAFEVALRLVSDKHPEGLARAQATYGELTACKKELAEYMAALMDAVKSPEMEKRRTAQVRYD